MKNTLFAVLLEIIILLDRFNIYILRYHLETVIKVLHKLVVCLSRYFTVLSKSSYRYLSAFDRGKETILDLCVVMFLPIWMSTFERLRFNTSPLPLLQLRFKTFLSGLDTYKRSF